MYRTVVLTFLWRWRLPRIKFNLTFRYCFYIGLSRIVHITLIVHFFHFQYCSKYYSSVPPQKPNFFMQLFYNIRDEMAKNKEMKRNLEQFRAEKKKLEQSDNLIKAR